MRKSNVNDKKAFSEILDLYRLEQKFKIVKEQYEDQKKKLSLGIRNYMYSKDYSQLDFKSREFGKVHVTHIIRKSIVWNVEKLRKSLDKDLADQVIEKKYIVNNMPGLIKLLKKSGVSPKQFKEFITVEEKVNQQKMNELSEIGEIDREDIEGCYELKEADGYLKINVKELENEEWQ